MASRRDVLPAWSSLPRVVLGHVTEYLDVRALGVSACVGQYTLRSAVATAWCRRAGGGVKSAGAAIRILQREVRERAMLRGHVARTDALTTLHSGSPGRSLDDLRFRIIIQGTRADGSIATMDWGDVRVVYSPDNEVLVLGTPMPAGAIIVDAGQVFSQKPTPGKLGPSSAPFFDWLRAIASGDDAETESLMQHGVNASITVRRGDAVVELARFGVGGSARRYTEINVKPGPQEGDADGPGQNDFLYCRTDSATGMRLHPTEGDFDLEYPREWSSEHGYIWDNLCCGTMVLFDAVSGGMEPKSCLLVFERNSEGPMASTEVRHTLHALLDAELVRAARDDLPAQVPFP